MCVLRVGVVVHSVQPQPEVKLSVGAAVLCHTCTGLKVGGVLSFADASWMERWVLGKCLKMSKNRTNKKDSLSIK